MRLAWFRPSRSRSGLFCDPSTALVDALKPDHLVDLIDETSADDARSTHHGGPYDLCVYELDGTRDGAWITPHLLESPGLTVLFSSSIAQRSEIVGASRVTVVPHAGLADALAAEYPAARVRSFDLPCPQPFATVPPLPVGTLAIGCLDSSPAGRALVDRAARRARDIGIAFSLITEASPLQLIERCQAVITLRWPPRGRPLTDAITVMAAGRVPIVYETLESSDWPAYDPQTWQQRDVVDARPPVCISLDPRDDEHSLVLSIRRLSTDGDMRRTIANAARAWWQEHGDPKRTVPRLVELLEEARSAPPPKHRT